MARPLLGSLTMSRARRTNRGFTLVELAVVVVIVGILAVIAVVAYRKLTLSSKLTEAQNMVSAIRIAEEDYKTEKGTYLNAGGFCPFDPTAAANANKKFMWDTTCGSFAQLPVHADGPVQFGYKVFAGPPGTPPTTPAVAVDTAALVTSRPWYVIQAKADLNGDGSTGLYTDVAMTSQGNQIFTQNVGE